MFFFHVSADLLEPLIASTRQTLVQPCHERVDLLPIDVKQPYARRNPLSVHKNNGARPLRNEEFVADQAQGDCSGLLSA